MKANNDKHAEHLEFSSIRELLDYFGDLGFEFEEPEETEEPEDTEVVQEEENVNSPSHYKIGGIECIDYIKAKLNNEMFIGYCLGNSIKYISRALYKGKFNEDIKKAIVYLKWIEQYEMIGDTLEP